MDRNIREVIEQLKEAIPYDEDVQDYLDDILDSTMYRAPEIQYLDWQRIGEVVSDAVHIMPGDDIEKVDEWKLEAVRIVMDLKTIDEVKEIHKER